MSKAHDPAQFYEDVDIVGRLITDLLRYEWLSKEDIDDLYTAKDAMIRVKGRITE